MTIRPREASLTALVEETVRRVGVDRLELVELIESEKEKLSPPAKELWEKLDVLLYLSPEEEVSPSPQERALMSQSANLPARDQVTFNVLSDLRAGLYSSDHEERGGQSGESHRNMSVIRAAMFKDRDEGRQVNLYETPEEAIVRLREGA